MCFILPEDEDDDSYICYICSHPPGIRDSKCRLDEVEDFMRSGAMTKLPIPPVSADAKASFMKDETRPRLTYCKSEGNMAVAVETLGTINTKGFVSQERLLVSIGKAVNDMNDQVHQVKDCLYSTRLRIHQLSSLTNGKNNPKEDAPFKGSVTPIRGSGGGEFRDHNYGSKSDGDWKTSTNDREPNRHTLGQGRLVWTK
jgi:hypothetical protein